MPATPDEAVDAMRNPARMTLMAAMVAIGIVAGGAPALAAPGDLDPSFGDGGIAQVRMTGDDPQVAQAVALAAGGRIVAAGTAGSRIALLRLTSAGAPDPSFGTDGKVVGPTGTLTGMGLQPDGRVVLSGQRVDATGVHQGVWRLNADGSPDDGSPADSTPGDTFAGDGFADTPSLPVAAPAPDGKITVVFGLTVRRLLATGEADPGFADTTTTPSDFGAGPGRGSIAFDASGRSVVGWTYTTTSAHPAGLVARFGASGADPSFGTGGSVERPGWAITAVATQDDSILTAGRQDVACTDHCVLGARLNPDGSPDGTFGSSGDWPAPAPPDGSWLNPPLAVGIAPGGQIVTAGTATVPNAAFLTQLGFGRFGADGAPDPLFGAAGLVHIPPVPDFTTSWRASSLAVQPDGGIAAAVSGLVVNATLVSPRFAVVRLQGVAPPTPPVAVTLPTITGVPGVGRNLVADPGTWSGSTPMTFAYQWRRCDATGADCVDIDGATTRKHLLTDEDLGHRLRVVVTATNAMGSASSRSAATKAIGVRPAVVTDPTITGLPGVGRTLTAGPGTWSGSTPMNFTYRWQRCDATGAACAPIDGADTRKYVLTGDDLGHRIRVVVTATNAAGSASSRSTATKVIGERPALLRPPGIGGVPEVGRVLTADPGSWTGSSPMGFTYQWQRCDTSGAGCAPIVGATTKKHVVDGDDLGHRLRVTVTATNLAGSASSRSAATGVVTGA